MYRDLMNWLNDPFQAFASSGRARCSTGLLAYAVVTFGQHLARLMITTSRLQQMPVWNLDSS